MPKPSDNRLKEAGQSCLEAVRILREHPEFDNFDQFNPGDDLTVNKMPEHFTLVTANVRFLKNGTEIFQNPPQLEDHDWPILVGDNILTEAAQRGAEQAGLSLTENERTYILPSEKGWVEVGYQFLHQTQAKAG